MTLFVWKFYEFCKSKQLFLSQDKIIVSVSGGIDSVALLCLLHELQKNIPFDLHIVHFNHGIRNESDKEQEFVCDLAKSKNIPIIIKNCNLKQCSSDVQNTARKWRYEELIKIKQQKKINKITLGHHLNDLVETQLWKLTRGSSLFSLKSMQIKNGIWIRPLLHLKKEDLKKYLLQKKQTWIEDSTNKDNDYTRNQIRNTIVPLLQKCSGGKLEEKMLSLSKESEYLNQQFLTHPATKYIKKTKIPYSIIKETPPLFSKEIIHRYLLFNGVEEVNRYHIEKIYELVHSNKGGWIVQLKNYVCVKGSQKNIIVQLP